MASTLRIKNILLIDDDPDDCYLFTDAVQQSFPELQVVCVENFLEAETQLHRQQPDLIFMDLNMPFKNGFECLTELKKHESFQSIPVIIFSSSNYPRDINKAYERGAALYYTKPVSFEILRGTLSQIIKNDWQEPSAITASYFIDGEYHAFKDSNSIV